MLVGCEMLTTDNAPDNNENVEDNQKVTIYHITDDIDVFESVFLAEDGNCLAIKKDTTFGFVAVIDSLKADDEKALVVYIDSLGKVRRVFNDGKSLDISYNSDENINLWYREADGTSEVFNEIKYTSTKAITKAGEVFDPTDFVSIGLALLDLKDLGDAVVFNPLIGEALKANIVADLLTTGPFSNTTTEILTGVTSVAITAAIGTSSVPIAVLLATIGVADAVISDWQNMVADSYFGTATPITGDAVQLTDNHFVISYSLNGVNPNQTDFNIGVIIADGLYITKKHHLLKKSISYDKSDTGYIIVNLKELDRKKGEKLKYRIYLEPANDNGFKWDDKLLDYWRYGEVKDFVIDEPALKIESTIQTKSSTYHGYRYTFDVNVNVINDIPFEPDDWGVAIYKTSLDECTNEDQQCDIKSAEGNGRQSISFSIIINDIMMDTEKIPYRPILHYFAVPYVSLDGQTIYLFDLASNLQLLHNPFNANIQYIQLNKVQDLAEISVSIELTIPETSNKQYTCYLTNCNNYCEYTDTLIPISTGESINLEINLVVNLDDILDYNSYIAKEFLNLRAVIKDSYNNILYISDPYNYELVYSETPSINVRSEFVQSYVEDDNRGIRSTVNKYQIITEVQGKFWFKNDSFKTQYTIVNVIPYLPELMDDYPPIGETRIEGGILKYYEDIHVEYFLGASASDRIDTEIIIFGILNNGVRIDSNPLIKTYSSTMR